MTLVEFKALYLKNEPVLVPVIERSRAQWGNYDGRPDFEQGAYTPLLTLVDDLVFISYQVFVYGHRTPTSKDRDFINAMSSFLDVRRDYLEFSDAYPPAVRGRNFINTGYGLGGADLPLLRPASLDMVHKVDSAEGSKHLLVLEYLLFEFAVLCIEMTYGDSVEAAQLRGDFNQAIYAHPEPPAQ